MAMMQLFSDAVDEALLNLQSNLGAFTQHESNENQEEIAAIVNYILDKEKPSDGAVSLEYTPFLRRYTTPTLILDDELNCKRRPLNYQ